jgi:cell wall-associated NlpC family hydrolase
MKGPGEAYASSAVAWALACVGERTYPLRCLAFVEDAYERANETEVFGGASARQSAELYGVEPYRADSPPPVGSLVFYRCSGLQHGEDIDWGHVGIALGDGRIVHAWDEVRADDATAIGSLAPAAGWTKPALLGWTPVERLLSGHRRRSWTDA